MTITNIDNIAVKGGVVRVIDSAVGDIARTTNGWIEDEKYGVYFVNDANNVSAKFDSTVTRTGRLTGRIITSSAAGKGRFILGFNGGTGSSLPAPRLSKYGIPVSPNTSYKLAVFVKYTNLASVGGFLAVHEHNISGTRLATNSLSTLSGTSDWVEKSITFTTNVSTAFVVIPIGPAAAGDAQDVSVDFNSIKFDVVSTITNSSSTPALLYPKGTAVTSNDNIDQSLDPAGAYANTYAIPTAIDEGATHRQTFTPTKKNNYSTKAWVIAKGTGDWTLIVHDSSNNEVASKTITNANLTDGAFNEFIDYWTWSSGVYHFHLMSTVADGTVKANTANDLETASFITLYSKNTTNFTVSTDTETLSVTAPTTDGWADGTVVEFTEPLTLAPGVNNIYYSSNGPATADGEVDPSLQATVGGVSVINENKGFFLLI